MLKALFYVCIALLSLGQFTLVSGPFTTRVTTPIYLFDLAIGGFTVMGVLVLLAHYKQFTLPKFSYLYLIFAFWALLSLFMQGLSWNVLLTSGFYWLRFFTYLLAGIVVYNLLDLKALTTQQIQRALILSGLFIAFAGFVQLVLLPDFTVLDAGLGWDPHKNRLASTFFDPNFVGAYLSMIFALALTAQKKSLTLAVLALALFLTISRSSWAFFALVIFVFGFFKSRIILLLSIVLIFAVYFAVPRVQTRISGITDPADSAHFRIISWKNTLAIAKDNLTLGVGFNSFRFAQKDYGFIDAGTLGGNAGAGSDSSFLLVLATTGVIGFVLFLAAYFYPVAMTLSTRPISLLVLAISFGLLLQTQFINAFFYPQIMFLYWNILALNSRF